MRNLCTGWREEGLGLGGEILAWAQPASQLLASWAHTRISPSATRVSPDKTRATWRFGMTCWNGWLASKSRRISKFNEQMQIRCKNMIPESCERNWFLMGVWMVFWTFWAKVQPDWFCLEFPKGGFLGNFREKKGSLSKSGVENPKFNGLVGESLGPPPQKKNKKKCFHDSRLHVRPSRVVYRSGGDPPNCF